ncbi:hypothetical protein CEXT_570371 [Caerostris extrusa]|uniref:Uncharacterized protein n=1 Tax=Caerostris extrusa TaxID=172846 RepID=A0AAV4QBW1_CAEEX|nr:hypothetical protein CEXT_570371 [Caerostris extrusa]
MEGLLATLVAVGTVAGHFLKCVAPHFEEDRGVLKGTSLKNSFSIVSYLLQWSLDLGLYFISSLFAGGRRVLISCLVHGDKF